ncbi:Uncharacterised protein [Vibrio cholerae]|nr:Uncharacterised protein [Vibrio cholerae]
MHGAEHRTSTHQNAPVCPSLGNLHFESNHLTYFA